MGKHVSFGVNLITPFSLWFIGFLGGGCILIAGVTIIEHLYTKGNWGYQFLIIITMLVSYMYRETFSSWKIIVLIGALLILVPFLALFKGQVAWFLDNVFNKRIPFFIIMAPFAFFAFRFSFYLAMTLPIYLDFRGSIFGRKNFYDFLDKYTYDIISWTPFFWRPKTVEELAKDEIIREKRAEIQANLEREHAQKEQDLKDAVAAKVMELKQQEIIRKR